MKYIANFLAILVLTGSQAAYALDDSRKGIIFGPGAGIHYTNLDYSFNDSTYLSESRTGFATSVKVGAGITNQFALYFVRNISWFIAPYDDGISTEDTIHTIDISGMGASYYFSPSAPSGYFLGAVGIGGYTAMSYNEDGEDKNDNAIAFMIGGGYEISNHLHLEATLLNTNTDDSDDSRYSTKASSFQFTINYLWY